jgi:hypothetical protein
MKNSKKTTLLLGEGIHQHTLYGSHRVDENNLTFAEVDVLDECELRHEHPNGSFGEHKTLLVEKGTWRTGVQVEYNPFLQSVGRVFD